MDDLMLCEGQHVRVFQKMIEGKRERNVPFIGRVMKVRGAGVNKMITVKQVLEGIEVEKIIPISLPTITKIEIIEEKPKRKHIRSSKSSKPAKSSASKKKKTSKK